MKINSSRFSKDASIAVFASAAILAYFLLRYPLGASRALFNVPLGIALLLGLTSWLINMGRKLAAGDWGADLLAGISIVTSFILGEYLAGTIIVLMLSSGASLERYASRRASRVLEALAKRMPQIAHRKRGTDVADVALADIAVGDVLVVFPQEICPADGVVLEGDGSMDESYLTGEPFEIAKAPGSTVLSGAINQSTALTVRAEKLPVDSRYAKIMQIMRKTEQNRPRLRRIGDRLGGVYAPVALLVAVGAWVASHDAGRFLAVLVVATPCPLLIAIPVAVLGAISLSAQRGIIIKNPAVLEQISTCRTVIFDKTGTLTYGKPFLTEVFCAPGFSRERVLKAAASLERYSKHPLSSAILQAAREARLPFEPVTQVTEKPGQGLRGTINGQTVQITGRGKMGRDTASLPPMSPGLECLIVINGQYAAAFRFQDAPREESRSFIRHLPPHHQINRVLLLSGDREAGVRYLAEEVGIQEVYFEKTPEQKVVIVKEEVRRQKTLFVGDGINDAPALLAATVGIAFGHENDITAEAADAVVLESSLRKVDELFHISRRMRSIALQSAVGGMALSAVGMAIAASGNLTPVAGAVIQEIIDLAAVLNAVRVAFPPRELSDYPSSPR